MFTRNLLWAAIGLMGVSTSTQGEWGRVKCLSQCNDQTCKSEDVRSECKENCESSVIGACLGTKIASQTSILSAPRRGPLPPPPPLELKKDLSNLNDTGLGRNGESPLETSSHIQKQKSDGSESFAKSIQQGAEKFQGKALTEAKITEASGLSDQHSQGLIPEKTNISDEGTADRISTRGIMMLLKQMKKLKSRINVNDVPSRLVKQGISYNNDNINIKRVGTGAFSDQVYIVTVKNTEILEGFDPKDPDKVPDTFVVKGLQWMSGKESLQIKNRTQQTPTKELQDLRRVKQFIAKKVSELKLEENKDFPSLCFAEETFYYFDSKDTKRFVAVLSLAGGSEMLDVAKELLEPDFFSETPGPKSSAKWLSIMEDLGKSLGTFHYQLASKEVKEQLLKGAIGLDEFKTVVHGDLHLGNIFFNNKTKKTTLIDVASIADSIYEPISVKRDLARLYLVTKYSNFSTSLEPVGLGMLNKGFVAFAKGYSEVFPKQKDKMRELVKGYLDGLTTECQEYYKECLANFVNTRKLKGFKSTRNIFEEPRNIMYHQIKYILLSLKGHSRQSAKRQKFEETVFSVIPWTTTLESGKVTIQEQKSLVESKKIHEKAANNDQSFYQGLTPDSDLSATKDSEYYYPDTEDSDPYVTHY